ncbi:hypothetical protein EI94DRAFT_1872893 [Lactarius quietus]|nr:hypothetical protein EI94DRAFT_1872893 [Lactarius quietus]
MTTEATVVTMVMAGQTEVTQPSNPKAKFMTGSDWRDWFQSLCSGGSGKYNCDWTLWHLACSCLAETGKKFLDLPDLPGLPGIGQNADAVYEIYSIKAFPTIPHGGSTLLALFYVEWVDDLLPYSSFHNNGPRQLRLTGSGVPGTPISKFAKTPTIS